MAGRHPSGKGFLRRWTRRHGAPRCLRIFDAARCRLPGPPRDARALGTLPPVPPNRCAPGRHFGLLQAAVAARLPSGASRPGSSVPSARACGLGGGAFAPHPSSDLGALRLLGADDGRLPPTFARGAQGLRLDASPRLLPVPEENPLRDFHQTSHEPCSRHQDKTVIRGILWLINSVASCAWRWRWTY